MFILKKRKVRYHPNNTSSILSAESQPKNVPAKHFIMMSASNLAWSCSLVQLESSMQRQVCYLGRRAIYNAPLTSVYPQRLRNPSSLVIHVLSSIWLLQSERGYE